MRAEVDGWPRQLGPEKPEMRRSAADFFHRYLTEPALAGLREPAALERLPQQERDLWRTFWEQVATRMRAERLVGSRQRMTQRRIESQASSD